MSLKAKIEAVIYAAEEPVTLAQLVAIFGAEVPTPDAAPMGHEITTLDEAGSMTDIASDGPEAGAPRLDSDTLDVANPEAGRQFDPGAEGASAATLGPREIRQYLQALVNELIAEYGDVKSGRERGMEIREIAGGFRMATKPEYHDAVRVFVKNLKPAMKLSPQALETLAVIAYKQPVTAPEIGEIRGVDSGGVLGSLISRKLVTTAGRKQVIGRPILYKTTKEFLLGFGLKDLSELPSMEEFEKMASELAESDALEAEAMNERAGIAPATDDAGSDLSPRAGSELSAREDLDLSSRPERSAVEVATSLPTPPDADQPDTIDEPVPQEQAQ
jgi:segregation and condensation protein B